MNSKRGQFYLIAAILIIVIIATSAIIYNYSRKKNPVVIYDLGEELKIESKNVLDYGTQDGGDMNDIWEGFVEDYASYAGEGKEFYFVYGNSEDWEKVECDGTSCGAASGIIWSGGKVIITIDEIEYQFDLEEGKYFYFIITQEIVGETYIVNGTS